MKRSAIAVGIVTLVSPIVLYFWIFQGVPSHDHTYWSEFGTIWGGIVGSLLNGIAIFILISNQISTEKKATLLEGEEQLLRYVNIYYQQMEKIDLLWRSTTKELDPFSYLVVRVNRKITADYAKSLICYYVKVPVASWPDNARYFFSGHMREALDLVEQLSGKGIEFHESRLDVPILDGKWQVLTEVERRELLEKVIPEKELYTGNKPDLFVSFVNSATRYFPSKHLVSSIQAVFKQYTTYFSPFFANYFYTLLSLEKLPESEKKIQFFVNQLSTSELICIYCKLIVSPDRELVVLHTSNCIFDRIDDGILEIFKSRQRAIDYLVQVSLNEVEEIC